MPLVRALSGARDPARLTLVSWNINSVRARLDNLAQLIRLTRPDVLLLQETRCADAHFPLPFLRRRGFRHAALNGRGGHHGVAILSRLPLAGRRADIIGGIDQPRHVSALVDWGSPLRLHSLYVPSGGDEPDPATDGKFRDKLAFLAALPAWGAAAVAERALVCGDFNVAPLPEDVWSHRQLLRVIGHTPAETAALEAFRIQNGWVDVVRRDRPPPERVFTWWSYRNAVWPGSDRGRRLDHAWASPPLAAGVTAEVLVAARGWPRASDHVPLVVRIATGGGLLPPPRPQW